MSRAAQAYGPAPTVRTEPLGGSPLARAALAGRVPAGWYPDVPAGPAAWQDRAAALRHQFRAGAWYEVLAPALDPRGPAAARLAEVVGGAGVVVTTGQQPGLFGGPLYALTKALSALGLADALREATGVPAAPVFWAATDDADFLEASRTYVAGAGGVETLDLVAAGAGAPLDGTPMSAVALGGEVEPLGERLRAAARSAASPAALDAALAAYRPGATVGSAYVALMRDLLEPLGIAVLDASHPSVRAGGFQLLRRALLVASQLEAAGAARSAEIVAAGFVPQVADVPGRAPVFRYDAAGRKARVTTEAARALVPRVAPHELGPNVLLRPVVERFLLPTAAYVAGPGEYAYFAQVSAIAAALAVPHPLAVPRWSGTVVEPHVQRALERLGAALDDFEDPHALARRLAHAGLPRAAADAIAGLRADVDARLSALREAGTGLGAGPLAGARAQLGHRVDRLERRLLAAEKRRDGAVARDLALAGASLRPFGGRQERVLNAVPLLARHGPALTDGLLACARAHGRAIVARGAGAFLAAGDAAR